MSVNWPLEITRIAYWKQILAKHDPDRSFPWHLPKVPASADRVVRAQEVAGFEFPKDYADFLTFSDGWPGFHILTDLFGAQDILSGRSRAVMQRADVKTFCLDNGIDQRNLAVVGASDQSDEVFFLFADRSVFLPGGVLWFAAREEIDRYLTFGEVFCSMVNYNALLAQDEAKKK
jgi:hypothetical protein